MYCKIYTSCTDSLKLPLLIHLDALPSALDSNLLRRETPSRTTPHVIFTQQLGCRSYAPLTARQSAFPLLRRNTTLEHKASHLINCPSKIIVDLIRDLAIPLVTRMARDKIPSPSSRSDQVTYVATSASFKQRCQLWNHPPDAAPVSYETAALTFRPMLDQIQIPPQLALRAHIDI